jgi:hypothetical protein
VRKIDPAIARILDDAGVDWRVEDRTRHRALVVEGRTIQILPHGSKRRESGCGNANAIAAVRRFLREERQQ